MVKSTLRGPVFGLLLLGLFLGLSPLASGQQKGKDKDKADKAPAADKKTEKKTEPDSMLNESPLPLDEATKLINKYLSEGWEANSLKPADKCSDYEFIRRASLDIIGRIASVKEVDRFMSDPASTRRHLLVDRLLARPPEPQTYEYAEYWSTIWTHWLMTRTGEGLYRTQIKLWLSEQFESEEFSIKQMAVDLLTAKGKSNDNGAVNYILAHLGGPTVQNNQPNPGVLQKEGQFDMVPVTSRTVRLFLGYQIQCTQCHDHPFNADWKQKHFWGVNAFFRQTQRVGDPTPRNQNNMMGPAQISLQDNADFNKSGIIFFEKRTGAFVSSEPVFLDGTRLPKNAERGSRREELAKFVVNHKNFAKAYINRMWGHFFGRGLNSKPAFDDFGEHNEVVHEEMLNALADQFVKANYNPRKLIRWITASDAYQLRAVANKSNDQVDAEAYMSRMLLKTMSPEQLLESLIVATRPNAVKNEAELEKFREDWMSRLVANFGDDEGNEGTFSGTVVQALLMMNGRDINQAVSLESGTVQDAINIAKGDKSLKGAEKTLSYLFKASLNRPATPKEFDEIGKKLGRAVMGKDELAQRLQDVFWALLNCNEFCLNH